MFTYISKSIFIENFNPDFTSKIQLWKILPQWIKLLVCLEIIPAPYNNVKVNKSQKKKSFKTFKLD